MAEAGSSSQSWGFARFGHRKCGLAGSDRASRVSLTLGFHGSSRCGTRDQIAELRNMDLGGGCTVGV